MHRAGSGTKCRRICARASCSARSVLRHLPQPETEDGRTRIGPDGSVEPGSEHRGVGKSRPKTSSRRDAAAGHAEAQSVLLRSTDGLAGDCVGSCCSHETETSGSGRSPDEPDGIRQRDSRNPRPRHRSRGISAGRRYQLRIRQRGERASNVARAGRRICYGSLESEPPGAGP